MLFIAMFILIPTLKFKLFVNRTFLKRIIVRRHKKGIQCQAVPRWNDSVPISERHHEHTSSNLIVCRWHIDILPRGGAQADGMHGNFAF